MSRKFIILLTVFIDVLGIGIIIPVLPFYVQSFGATPFTVTLLFAVYSFFSFFSAPLLGALSDKLGRRPILIISIFSTSLGWLIFAGANKIIWLFVGRIADGAAAGNFPIAQSYLLDIAKNDKEKTTNLGLIGAIFGVGLIIGPALGGFLSSISLSLPFWIVGGLAFINGILAIFNLPETNAHQNKDKIIELSPFKPLRRAFKNKDLRPIFFAWFLMGLALASQQSILSLYLNKEFLFNSTTVGLVITGSGLILIFNQAFALKKIWLKNFKEEILMFSLMALLAGGFLFMGITYLWSFLLGLVAISLAQSVLRAVLTSQAAKKDGQANHGAILGVMNSIMSLAMIIGPLMAGTLFGLKSNWPFWASALCALLAALILLFKHQQDENTVFGLNEEELILEEQRSELV
jgi:MFS family permease